MIIDINEQLEKLVSLKGPFASFMLNEVPETPDKLFISWLQDAIKQGIQEPYAMTLSTIDAQENPDARILILKRIDERGWYFATSRAGKKGRQIQRQPRATLTFYWPPLGRQIRIRGIVTEMGPEESAIDFLRRSDVARAVAMTERQSMRLTSLSELDIAIAQQHQKLKQQPDIVAPSWTLYCLQANEVEFWQASTDRIHQRLLYVLQNDFWKKHLLWP